MTDSQEGSREPWWRTPTGIGALVTATASIVVALIAGIFGLLNSGAGDDQGSRGGAATTVSSSATTGSVTTVDSATAPTTAGAENADVFREVAGPGDLNYQFTLAYKEGVDLDNQQKVLSEAAGADLLNGIRALNTLDAYDISGDQKMYRFTGQPTRQNCERLVSSNGSYEIGIFLDQLHKGDQFCLRTDGKHLVHLLIEDIRRGTGSATDLDFRVALWS